VCADQFIRIEPFSKFEELVDDWMAQYFPDNRSSFGHRTQAKTIKKLLTDHHVGTIVFEPQYIDRHFFDDFAAYYSMCFHSYPRLGTRLHFFAEAYDKNAAEAFRSSLNGPVEKMDGLTNVFGEYIGFLVIRPLPQTMIGRTCIKAPQVLAEHVFIHRKYDAHLYGYKLRVKSLAFQEQDRTVSACATSALWTCFHKTKKVFGHQSLSPSEITNMASSMTPRANEGTTIPGLTASQMQDAMRAMKLVPLFFDKDKLGYVNQIVYSYCTKLFLPCILGFSICTAEYDDQNKKWKLVEHNKHAVTVVGYSFEPTKESLATEEEKRIFESMHAKPEGGNGGGQTTDDSVREYFKSSGMTTIYVHDDATGPYQGINFRQLENVDCVLIDEKRFPVSITHYSNGDFWVPLFLIVPVYHKMRLLLFTPHAATCEFHEFYKGIRVNRLDQLEKVEPYNKEYADLLPEILKWDTYLIEGHQLKGILRESKYFSLDRLSYRRELLEEHWPKYVWRSVGFVQGEKPIVELLFDATESEQGSSLFKAIIYDEILGDLLRGGMIPEVLEKTFRNPRFKHLQKVLPWFMKNIGFEKETDEQQKKRIADQNELLKELIPAGEQAHIEDREQELAQKRKMELMKCETAAKQARETSDPAALEDDKLMKNDATASDKKEHATTELDSYEPQKVPAFRNQYDGTT